MEHSTEDDGMEAGEKELNKAAPYSSQQALYKNNEIKEEEEMQHIDSQLYGNGGDNGLLGVALLSGLLGGGRRDNDNCIAATLNAGFDGINHNINNSSVGINHNINSVGMGITHNINAALNALTSLDLMDKLGDIEGSIPLSACETQKSVHEAESSITGQLLQQSIANLQGQAQLGLGIANAVSTAKDLAASQTQTLTELINNVGNAVDRNLFQLTATVKDDGEKTRALITHNTIAELNRIASERQDEILELRHEGRRRDDRHGIDITMINNQNQNQLQFQQQQQILGQLASILANTNQRIEATNQAINIGGTQLAGQSNSSANTRVN